MNTSNFALRRAARKASRTSIERLESREMLAVDTVLLEYEGVEQEAVSGEYVVELDEVSAIAGLASSFSDIASEVEIHSVGASPVARVHAPTLTLEEVSARLANDDAVTSVSPNFTYASTFLPNDPGYGGLWGLENTGQNLQEWDSTTTSFLDVPGTGGAIDADVDAEGAWAYTTGSTDVVVGVIDSGIDYTHPDLYLNVWINQGEIPSTIMSTLTDTDSDGLITFHDLNDTANWNSGNPYVVDLNNTGYIDAGDLLGKPNQFNIDIDVQTDWEDGDSDGNGYDDDLIGWDFANDDNDPIDTHYHGTHVSGTVAASGGNSAGVVGLANGAMVATMQFMNTTEDGESRGSTSAAIAAIDYATTLRSTGSTNLVATNNSWGGNLASPALQQAIKRQTDADVVFVAAAGNSERDNDGALAAFPATYSLTNPRVVAVASSNNADDLSFFSNYGETSVTLAAPGSDIVSTTPTYFTLPMVLRPLTAVYGTLSGTSMAAPHVTATVALLASQIPTAGPDELLDALLAGVDGDANYTETNRTNGRLNAANALAIASTTGPIATAVAIAGQSEQAWYTTGPIESYAAVSQLLVSFDQDIAAASVTSAGVSLVEAGVDSVFGTADDVAVPITNPQLSLPATNEVELALGGVLAPGAYRLTLNEDPANEWQGVSGAAVYDGGRYDYFFDTIQPSGAFESNEALSSAHPLGTLGSGLTGVTDIDLRVGDGLYGLSDVDLFEFTTTQEFDASFGVVEAGGGFDSYLRLFASDGTELAANDDSTSYAASVHVAALPAGNYFLGVSGSRNADYDPTASGSGVEALAGGEYSLEIDLSSTTSPDREIRGVVWHDIDSDGVVDAGESPVSGALAFIDANLNGVADTSEEQVLTDDTGSYSLVDLAPGAHTVVVAPGPGWANTTSNASQSVVAPASGEAVASSVGLALSDASLGEFVVNTIADSTDDTADLPSNLSLRKAIELAGLYGVDRIAFDPALASQSISLEKGRLLIDDTLTIAGVPGAKPSLTANGVDRLFDVAGSADLALESLSLTGGYSTGNGGAILNSGVLTLTDIDVASSESAADGGGIYNEGIANLYESSVSGNTAQSNGGGISNTGTLLMVDSTLQGNTAQGMGDAITIFSELAGVQLELTSEVRGGGGLYSEGGGFTLQTTSVVNNTAMGQGAGILAARTAVGNEIIGSYVAGNTITADLPGTFQYGGGVLSYDASLPEGVPSLAVRESVIHGNSIDTANGGGAGLAFATESPNGNQVSFGGGPSRFSIVESSEISSNESGANSGGIRVDEATLVEIHDSAITGNSTRFLFPEPHPTGAARPSTGGGIRINGDAVMRNVTVSGNALAGEVVAGAGVFVGSGASLDAEHVTIVGNTGVGDFVSRFNYGGGIAFTTPSLSRFTNSVAAGNSINATGAQQDSQDVLLTDSAPLGAGSGSNFFGIVRSPIAAGVDGNLGGTLASPQDPLLSPLGYFGGPTQSHVPLHGSPLIDSGATLAGVSDQRGGKFGRDADGDNDGVSKPDMGAVESQEARVVAVKAIAGSGGGLNDFRSSFGHASIGPSTAGASGQLTPLPFGSIGSLEVQFSEEVVVQSSDLRVIGSRTATQPTVSAFTYDATSSIATWSFTNWSEADQYVIEISDQVTNGYGVGLDGEWLNPAAIGAPAPAVADNASGDGAAGGKFSFLLTHLPGDLDQNGVVNITDFGLLSDGLGITAGADYADGDIDGDGDVDTDDFNLLSNNYDLDLRDAAFLLADFDGDLDVDNDDFNLFAAAYAASHASADLNGNGVVDISDFGLFADQLDLDVETA